MRKKVCIFCGANEGKSEEIIRQSKEICQLLIEKKCDLVYGGGKTGLMGIIANEFLNAKCEVIGVRPSKLIADEDAHSGLSKLIVVETMADRKDKMTELSDFFIALPGGVGTLDEIIETYTLQKIGFISKPSAILNSNGYYDGLIDLLDKMVDKGFLNTSARQKLVLEKSPKEVVEALFETVNKKEGSKIIDKIAFIEIKEGKILMTKSFGKAKFYIPGGKRDSGEKDEETLIREIFEELSVHIAKGSSKYVGTFEAQADGKAEGTKVRLSCYKAKYSGVLKANNEIEKIEWLNYSDIEKVSYVDEIIFKFLNDKGELH